MNYYIEQVKNGVADFSLGDYKLSSALGMIEPQKPSRMLEDAFGILESYGFHLSFHKNISDTIIGEPFHLVSSERELEILIERGGSNTFSKALVIMIDFFTTPIRASQQFVLKEFFNKCIIATHSIKTFLNTDEELPRPGGFTSFLLMGGEHLPGISYDLVEKPSLEPRVSKSDFDFSWVNKALEISKSLIPMSTLGMCEFSIFLKSIGEGRGSINIPPSGYVILKETISKDLFNLKTLRGTPLPNQNGVILNLNNLAYSLIEHGEEPKNVYNRIDYTLHSSYRANRSWRKLNTLLITQKDLPKT